MDVYPEIQQLNHMLSAYQMSIEPSDKGFFFHTSFKPIRLTVAGKNFMLYVDDEYNDLKVENQALWLCLVLLELEEYQDEDDYLTWCRAKGLNATNDELRNYYISLSEIYNSIENSIGEIYSPVSSYDFELNAGAAQALREK